MFDIADVRYGLEMVRMVVRLHRYSEWTCTAAPRPMMRATDIIRFEYY